MMNFTKKQGCKLLPGTRLLGKWHRKPYKILRELGAGANGTVYLAEAVHGLVALKVGTDSMSIASEVNVLKHFAKVQGAKLGPSLFDVDDVTIGGDTYPFYAMEYVRGEDFLRYVQTRGSEWLGLLMIQLLKDLHHLHEAGWVFGDLKPDNLLVQGPPPRIRLLDVGGTTQIGRSIKEYTEFFDRGYWGLGSRRAEPSYDLFSVAMIMINSAYPKRFEKPKENPLPFLKRRIQENDVLVPYSRPLMKALAGKYKAASEMREDLLKAVHHVDTLPKKKQVKHKEKKPSYFIDIFLIITFFILLYILYLFGKTM